MNARPSATVVPLSRRAKRGHMIARKSVISELDARVAQLEKIVAQFDKRLSRGAFRRPFQIAIVSSLLLHVLVIALVTFKMPDVARDQSDKPLEIVLVNAKSKNKPLQPRAQAQHNLDGGGNTDADRRAKSPMPLLRNDPQSNDVAEAQKRVAQLEQEVRRQLLAMQQSKFSTDTATPQPAPQVEPRPEAPPSLTQDDIQRSLNMQRLEAEISRNWDAYQKRPRRHAMGASTSEYRFARYVEDWRVKVERVGEANYPQAARDKQIYGSLLLTVSIRADGSIEKIVMRRPSGHKVLDEAAVRIVRMGAPYAAFPPDVAKDTDVIDISRTWRFTRSDRLETE